MKLYKFLKGNKYIHVLANNILEARKWIAIKHEGSKFITIEKTIYGSENKGRKLIE